MKFKIGDRVIFTNDYGIVFDEVTTVNGYLTERKPYQHEYRYYLSWKCHLFPVKETSLQHYQQ